RPLRGGDREEVHHVHGQAAPLRRALNDLGKHLACALLARKIVRSAEGPPGCLEPVLGERRLQIGHRVALDPDVRLAPVALAASIVGAKDGSSIVTRGTTMGLGLRTQETVVTVRIPRITSTPD